MTKSHRAPPAKVSEAKPTSGESDKPSSSPDNSFMLAVLETAIQEQGAEQSILSFAAENGFDPEQLQFAEDGDRKKQDAPLPELREKHQGDHEYGEFEAGVAFVKGEGDEHAVDPNDVAQGALGDCYLMAGMLSVARANPQLIQDIIEDKGDGTFDVTLYIRESYAHPPKPVTTTIDARVPEKYKGKPLYAKIGDVSEEAEEMWPALIEKAVAQQKGSYDKISGGNIAKDGFAFAGATELLTGEREGYMKTEDLDEDDVLLHIEIALEEGKPVTCDSRNMEDDAALAKEAVKYNVYGNHAYAPASVDLNGRTLELSNPWGSHNVEGLPVADFKRFYRSIRIGG